MKVLSLFDGMSCGRIALERAGIKVTEYYASEIDIHAIKVSKHNWPDIIHIGDVTKVRYFEGFLYTEKGTFWVGHFDLIIGGSPCQGFSFAGLQLNFDDPRSKLFFEFVRLREETEATYFFLENVVMKQAYQDVISEKMGVEPILINSIDFSAQNRERLYWSNIPYFDYKPKYISFQDIKDTDVVKYNYLTDKATERAKNNSRSRIIQENAIKTGSILFNQGKQATDSISVLMHDGRVRWLTRNEVERLQGVEDNYTKYVGECAAISMLGNGWNVETIVHLFKPLYWHDVI